MTVIVTGFFFNVLFWLMNPSTSRSEKKNNYIPLGVFSIVKKLGNFELKTIFYIYTNIIQVIQMYKTLLKLYLC